MNRQILVIGLMLLISSVAFGTEINSEFMENILTVSISDVSDLAGFQFTVNYNPDVLEYVSIEEGPFLNENGAINTFFNQGKTETSGKAEYVAAVRIGETSGVSGSGILATITFNRLAEGNPTITLSDVMLTNSATEEIEATVNETEVIEQPTPTPTPTPTTTGQQAADNTLLYGAIVIVVIILVGAYFFRDKLGFK